jgi:hypothetical protein
MATTRRHNIYKVIVNDEEQSLHLAGESNEPRFGVLSRM